MNAQGFWPGLTKAVALLVATAAAASVLVFAVVAALAIAVIGLATLLVAWAIDPREVSSLVGALVSHIDGWFERLGDLSQTVREVVSTVTGAVSPAPEEDPAASASVPEDAPARPAKPRSRARSTAARSAARPARGSDQRAASLWAAQSGRVYDPEPEDPAKKSARE